MSSLLARLRAPTLQNTGSVARDHLANERTFMSWLRTGLGFIALGIAVERFSQLPDPSSFSPAQQQTQQQSQPQTPQQQAQPPAQQQQQQQQAAQEQEAIHAELRKFKEREQAVVAALLGAGSGSVVYGVSRYYEVMRLLQRGLYKPAFYGAGALGGAVAALAGAAYWGALKDQRDRWHGEGEGAG